MPAHETTIMCPLGEKDGREGNKPTTALK